MGNTLNGTPDINGHHFGNFVFINGFAVADSSFSQASFSFSEVEDNFFFVSEIGRQFEVLAFHGGNLFFFYFFNFFFKLHNAFRNIDV